MTARWDGASTMSRDIVEVLPFEIWQRCIAQACYGDHYMATLLKLTLVSRRWCQLLTGTPTLWSNIHINDADEDSLATIAVFLHLSCKAQLSLIIWVPLSVKWDTIYPIFLPHRGRIREITVQIKSEFHSATCGLKTTISDVVIQQNLQRVFVTLRFPTSVEYLDVIPDHPVRMESIWMPSNIVSAGNWLVPLHALQHPSHSPSRLYHLSMSAIDLVNFLPYLSAFERLQTLHLHSDGQEYPHPPLSPLDAVTPLHLPFLTTLRYHGRLYWASTRLFGAVAQTMQNLELHIGILDLEEAIHSLNAGKALRRFSLMLEHGIDNSKKRRLPKINIPKWRLTKLEDFRCEIKPLENDQSARNLDSDHLWQLFHTIFPRLYTLVWNLPLGPRALLISLIRQKRLRRFESNVASAPFSRQTTKFVFNTLDSLHVKDAQMLQGVAIANLLKFSVTFQNDLNFPANFTFALLYSLDLTISDCIKSPCDIKSGDFPVLNILSLTFLGPSCHFQPLNLPSLTEITISTWSPTFPQPMEFCASLISQPRNCPRLEQVNLDSFLEWDILYLLLWRRNYLREKPVSRINRLGLRFLPPKFHPTFVSLLAGRPIPSLPILTWMTRLSIQGTQSRLLDQEIIGCFCCVRWELADCNEPLHSSRLPEEYRISQKDDWIFSDTIEPLGLFPLYSWDIAGPVIPKFSAYQHVWMEEHRKKAGEWRSAAYKWSKLHHRTLVCHKQLCTPKVMLTEYDMEDDKGQAHTSLLALLSLAECDELRDSIRFLIPPLIDLLHDNDHDVRSDAASTHAKLAENVELRGSIRPAIPRLIELLKDQYLEVRVAAASALAKLSEHGESPQSLHETSLIQCEYEVELRPAIRPAIPTFMELRKDQQPVVQSAATSALAELVEYVEFYNATILAIPQLIELLKDQQSGVRSVASLELAKLAERVELHDWIQPAVPQFFELLKDLYPDVRSAATSALAELAEHATPAIPRLTDLLKDQHSNVRLAAVSALAKLTEHGELCDSIRPAILHLIDLLKDHSADVRAAAIFALAKLAEHVVFHDAICPAIPKIMDLLTDQSSEVRSATIFALARFVQKSDFHDAIRLAIPRLMSLLTDQYSYGQSAAISALTRLAEHVELHDAIRPTIQRLMDLLTDQFSYVRSAATSALAKLAEHVELHDAIRPAIPRLMDLLKDQASVRLAATSALAKLASTEASHGIE